MVQACNTDHDYCVSCIYSSIASFQVKSLLIRSSNNSAMIPKSSTKRSSKGNQEQNSRDKGFKHNDEEQQAEYPALMNADLHFKLFTVLLTNTDIGPRIGIHPLHHSHNPLLHTKFSQRPPDDLLRYSIRGLEQKPCRVSCWQLATSLAAAFVQRLHLLCLCLGYSQTGNHRLTPTV